MSPKSKQRPSEPAPVHPAFRHVPVGLEDIAIEALEAFGDLNERVTEWLEARHVATGRNNTFTEEVVLLMVLGRYRRTIASLGHGEGSDNAEALAEVFLDEVFDAEAEAESEGERH